MKIARRHLMRACPEDLKRFARWLKLRDTDRMSHRHLAKLVMWLITRREKRERGLIAGEPTYTGYYG